MRTNREKIAEDFSNASHLLDKELEASVSRAQGYEVYQNRCGDKIVRHSIYVALYICIAVLMLVFRHIYFSWFGLELLWTGQVSFGITFGLFILGTIASLEVVKVSSENKKRFKEVSSVFSVIEERQKKKKEAIAKFRDQLFYLESSANHKQKLPSELPKLKTKQNSNEKALDDLPVSNFILAGSTLFTTLAISICLVLTVALVFIAALLAIGIVEQSETLIWWWAGASGVIGAGLGGWFTLVKVLDDWGYSFDEDSFLPVILVPYLFIVSIILGLLVGVLVLIILLIRFVVSYYSALSVSGQVYFIFISCLVVLGIGAFIDWWRRS